MTTAFKLGEMPVGAGAAPVFLPDIGTFFNSDMGCALAMVDQLVDAGAKIVKGEILHDPDICLDDDTQIPYVARDGSVHSERYRDLIERKTLSLRSYEKLFSHVRGRGADFVVSVYDRSGLDFARSLGACAIKIATSNIVHRPLIEHAARSGLPVIFDTGDSSLEEIDRAVTWARDAGATELVVEHSPYPPPASVDRHDLRFMVEMGQVFDLPFGLSDHHAGDEMLYAAVALGASIVEKGVCPDELLIEQDVAHALPISMFGEALAKANNIHRALGRPSRALKRDRPKKLSRMGLIASRDLQRGDPVKEDNVAFAFPAKGIPVEHWEIVRDLRLQGDVARGQPIRWADVAA